MVEITRTVDVAKPARVASGMAHQEARRLHHRYLGPEHVLLGLLLHDDNQAARVLRAHGLDLATVRTEVDRLITQGVLPGPQPSDSELLATLGIDLDAVSRRVNETFGDDAYWRAAQRVRLRSSQPVVHLRSSDPLPPVCARGLGIAAQEAIARDQEVGPEHLLLGLLDDAEDLVETETNPTERRTRTLVGLPDHGPHAIKLLVEARGSTLEALRSALRGELDRQQ